jgi:hypothetical protein
MVGIFHNPNPQEDAMNQFIQQYEKDIIGHLSGFDRLVLRGTLRALAVKSGMLNYLWLVGVHMKDFARFCKEKSEQLKTASLAQAQRLHRPILYLPSPKRSKEEVARQIAQKDGLRKGLICVLTAVEPCQSYEVFRNKEKKKLELQPRIRKCLFLYHYWMDPRFGFMHGRIQSWFPFTIQVCLNGREWLARQMDRVGLRYQRRQNCFPWIKNIPKAQGLMDQQLQTDWPSTLRAVARRLNPAHEEMLAPYRVDYYWSTHQSEWATDIMFPSPTALAKIYPVLVRSGISTFGSQEVMRFLGQKLHGNFQGEVVSHYAQRPEGIRLKHELKANSIKVYDKEGSVLRVETTLNNPRDFKVYRPKEGDPGGPPSWQRMRKGISDLHRRAELSQASNERYLNALASIQVDRLLGEVVPSVCRPTHWKGQRLRPLRPWSKEDTLLLETISRGEFNIQGFRNRDLRNHLFPGQHDLPTQRRLSARITHRLRLLRAHGIIRKVPCTLRYVLTKKGRQIITAIIHTQHVPINKLSELAA